MTLALKLTKNIHWI